MTPLYIAPARLAPAKTGRTDACRGRCRLILAPVRVWGLRRTAGRVRTRELPTDA
jgi:hypothetical protein